MPNKFPTSLCIKDTFHVDKAQATLEKDRLMIMNDIEKSIGSQQMSMTVKNALLESSLADVASLESSSNLNPETLISSLLSCSQLHRFAGQLTVAEQGAESAFHLAKEKLSSDNACIPTSMDNLAIIKNVQGKSGEAEKLHRSSRTEKEAAWRRTSINYSILGQSCCSAE